MTAPLDGVDRAVVVATSPRLPAGQLTWGAWSALRDGPVLMGRADHPQREALRDAGVDAVVVPGTPGEQADAVRERARAGSAVWLAEPGDVDDDPVVAALGALDVDLAVVVGAVDPPGAHVLDAVAVMDRLRSPGGCPWDAEQTHASLARYLLEEAYETVETIEAGDDDALRDELGDVLLQVLFHARLAEEHPEASRWTLDDVADGLVAKLVRRHPHVFADVAVTDAEDVDARWDALKAAEGRTSVTSGVAMGQPALSLAAKLVSRAARVGLPADLVSRPLETAETPAQAVAAAAASLLDEDVPPRVDRVGDLLLAAVVLARQVDVDPEAALRGAARRFRDRLVAVEDTVRAEGGDPAELRELGWRERWR